MWGEQATQSGWPPGRYDFPSTVCVPSPPASGALAGDRKSGRGRNAGDQISSQPQTHRTLPTMQLREATPRLGGGGEERRKDAWALGSVPSLGAGWSELERKSRVRGRQQRPLRIWEKNRHYGRSDGSFSSEPGPDQTQRARPPVWVSILLSPSLASLPSKAQAVPVAFISLFPPVT